MGNETGKKMVAYLRGDLEIDPDRYRAAQTNEERDIGKERTGKKKNKMKKIISPKKNKLDSSKQIP